MTDRKRVELSLTQNAPLLEDSEKLSRRNLRALGGLSKSSNAIVTKRKTGYKGAFDYNVLPDRKTIYCRAHMDRISFKVIPVRGVFRKDFQEYENISI